MLTGQAKRDYQREWVRQKRARVRQGSTHSVRPEDIVIIDYKDAKQEKLAELRKLMDNPPSRSVERRLNIQVPRYNARIHKKGDTVRMPGGEVVVVPELDEMGNVLEAF